MFISQLLIFLVSRNAYNARLLYYIVCVILREVGVTSYTIIPLGIFLSDLCVPYLQLPVSKNGDLDEY